MKINFPWRHAFITAIIVALFSIIFFSLLDYLNHNQHWQIMPMTLRGISGLVTLVLLGIGIYLGMQKTKEKGEGILSYKDAVLSGIVISLITGLVTALFAFLYCGFINPAFAGYMLAESKKIMIMQGTTGPNIEKELSDLAKQLTTPFQVMQAFVGQLIAGTLISLILGLFIHKKIK